MDYKEVLENQIKILVEVQEQVLKGILERSESVAYTGRTLGLIIDTSERIESLAIALINIQKE